MTDDSNSSARPKAVSGAQTPARAPAPAAVSSSAALAVSSLRRRGDLKPGTELGRFRITGVLGRGGMGVVYSATDPLGGRPVAIKRLPSDLTPDSPHVQRLLREFRAAAGVRHPNAVAALEVGEHSDGYYLVMELIDGPSMSAWVEKHGPPPWREATRITAAIARALGAAHAAGLVHRDVKPGNILRASDGSVKLADFGLAKSEEGFDPTVTMANEVVGSPHFMSPEQARAKPLDSRSDLYSLGATYYNLLTGRPPFADCVTSLTAMTAQVQRPVPDPRTLVPSLPLGCWLIVRRSMTKDPAGRYQTAEEMAVDLDDVAEGRQPRIASGAADDVTETVEIPAPPAAESDASPDDVSTRPVTPPVIPAAARAPQERPTRLIAPVAPSARRPPAGGAAPAPAPVSRVGPDPTKLKSPLNEVPTSASDEFLRPMAPDESPDNRSTATLPAARSGIETVRTAGLSGDEGPDPLADVPVVPTSAWIALIAALALLAGAIGGLLWMLNRS
jgi:serine/threonine protein kinase